MLPLPPLPTPRRRLALAWWLAAALLLAQTLGLAHHVLHTQAAAPDTALFGHHDRADCQFFDQLALGDALAPAPPALPALPPAVAPVVAVAAAATAVGTAAYQARAPPHG